jgi:hypothetical protein
VQASYVFFKADFQICKQCTLGADRLIEDPVLKEFIYLFESDPLGKVCPPSFTFLKEIMKNKLGIPLLEHVDFELVVRLDEMNDRIDAFPADRNAKPFVCMHCIKRAQDDSVTIPLFLEHVDGGHIWLETDHVDWLGYVIVDLNPWSIDEDVQFEGSHENSYPYIS